MVILLGLAGGQRHRRAAGVARAAPEGQRCCWRRPGQARPSVRV